MASEMQPNLSPVVRCYNNPGIPESLKTRYTAEGLFVADYESGWSLESEHIADSNRKSAASTAFGEMIDISKYGGYGVLTAPNTEIITVGEWKPNCMTFRTADKNGKEVQLKGIQMSKYALLTSEDDLYDSISDIFTDTGGVTVRSVSDNRDTIKSTLEHLDGQGRIRGPVDR